MEGDRCDIFKFSDSGRLKLGSVLKLSSRGAAGNVHSSFTRKKCKIVYDISDSSSSDEGSEDYRGKPVRKRRRGMSSKKSLAVSRLLDKKTPKNDDAEEPGLLTSPTKRHRSRSPSIESTPSPPSRALLQPSPPPPGLFLQDSTTDNTARQVLNQANDMLNRLRYDSPYTVPIPSSDYLDLSPSLSMVETETITLRVRCKGKVHRYNVEKIAPFSNVISVLSKDLGVSDDDKILLSHKTATLMPTDSPSSTDLTTADIIDAVVMKEAGFPDQKCSSADMQNDLRHGDITIKVQTANKHKVYKISRDDPLHKVMTAFSSELGIPILQLKFLFDGDGIQPLQTAKDFDMEDNDCIDVMVLKL